MKTRELASQDDTRDLEHDIYCASECALSAVRRLVEEGDAIRMLQAIKFEKIGRDPLQSTRSLNLIEQVNQTFTALVTVRAVDYLFNHHPESAPFRVNLGTASGPDIKSIDGSVVAEVFAATDPRSNNKLRNDIAKVAESKAKNGYVFFHCPGIYHSKTEGEVKVIPLGLQLRRATAHRNHRLVSILSRVVQNLAVRVSREIAFRIKAALGTHLPKGRKK